MPYARLTLVMGTALAASSVHAESSLVRLRTLSATSTLPSQDSRYAPEAAIDGNESTAWCEGRDGAAAGEGLTLEFDEPTPLDGIQIVTGFRKSAKLFRANDAPTRLAVVVDDRPSLTYDTKAAWDVRAAR